MADVIDQAAEKYRNDLKHLSEWQIGSFNATIGYALAAIRGLVLINGGAAVALLTFLANIWSKDAKIKTAAEALKLPLQLFLVGVALGVGCAGVAYLSQSYLSSLRTKVGVPLQILGILLAICSLATFVVGAWKAADVLSLAVGT